MTSERFTTLERNQQPYYYTERMSYQGAPVERDVQVEYVKPRFGPCMWIVAVIFVLFIIVLIICLIIFFTWGAAYRPSGNAEAGRLADKGGYFFDLETPKFVLDALKANSPKICLLDTAFLVPNYAQRYVEEHIPSARHFDISKVTKRQSDGSYQIAHPLDFQTYARSLGIDKDCQVVTYDHGEAANSVTTATFVWTLFKLFGQQKVSVMNGGLKAWRKLAGSDATYKATSTATKAAKDGDFEAMWDSKFTVGFSDVQSAVQGGKIRLADTRKPDDYKGVTKAADAKDGGHIRGALNAPTDDMLDSDGSLKILPEQKKWMTAKGLETSRQTIVYDNDPLLASALSFVMIQAGYDVKLYDGGWVEWSYKAPQELKERGI